MPEYKLHFFNLYGRGEPIRLCFAAAGVKYEDIRYTFEEWGQKKQEGVLSFNGYLPVLEVDGRKLCESMAIMRYVARECGLTPSDSFDVAVCDMIVNMDYDCFQLMAKTFQEKDEQRKKVLNDEFMKTHIPAFFTKINKLLKENNGGKGYLVGNKLSYADILIFTTCGREPFQMVLDNYPELKGHYQRIGNVPGIKAWVEIRPKTAM